MGRSFAIHLAGLLLLWVLLTGGAADSWLVGGPVAVLAAWAGAALAPSVSWIVRPWAVLAFLPFFLFHSLRGAWDVGRRALDPQLPLDPGMLAYTCRLPPGPPRTFFANVISLLPGTLFVGDEEGAVRLHVIDRGLALDGELAALERRVAALFGVSREAGD